MATERMRLVDTYRGNVFDLFRYEKGSSRIEFQHIHSVATLPDEWWLHTYCERPDGSKDSFLTQGPFATRKQARRRLY